MRDMYLEDMEYRVTGIEPEHAIWKCDRKGKSFVSGYRPAYLYKNSK
jgi:hypothetical protein